MTMIMQAELLTPWLCEERTRLACRWTLMWSASFEKGREALFSYKEHQPDVVLMDIRMPVMDGITAVDTHEDILTVNSLRRNLKSLPYLKDFPDSQSRTFIASWHPQGAPSWPEPLKNPRQIQSGAPDQVWTSERS